MATRMTSVQPIEGVSGGEPVVTALPPGAATDAHLDTTIGTAADAKVDTDAVGTLSSKLRGIVSLLVTGIKQWTSAKGASVALAITGKDVGPNVNTLDVWDNAPTQATYNYSTTRGDGIAVRLANTTITFTGPAIVSSQLCRVRVFIDATTKPVIWEQGRNAVLSISGTTITVTALDGTVITVPAAATLVEVMWAAQDKSFDASLGATRNAPMFGPNSMYDDPYAIVDTTAIPVSAAVYYYPSSAGIDMSGRCDIAFDFSAVAGAGASPLYLWIEACDDNTFPGATALPTTSPLNISYNCGLITSATPLGNQSVTATAGATARGIWQAENLNAKFVRFCFLSPAGNAAVSGAVKAFARSKYQ